MKKNNLLYGLTEEEWLKVLNEFGVSIGFLERTKSGKIKITNEQIRKILEQSKIEIPGPKDDWDDYRA